MSRRAARRAAAAAAAAAAVASITKSRIAAPVVTEFGGKGMSKGKGKGKVGNGEKGAKAIGKRPGRREPTAAPAGDADGSGSRGPRVTTGPAVLPPPTLLGDPIGEQQDHEEDNNNVSDNIMSPVLPAVPRTPTRAGRRRRR